MNTSFANLSEQKSDRSIAAANNPSSFKLIHVVDDSVVVGLTLDPDASPESKLKHVETKHSVEVQSSQKKPELAQTSQIADVEYLVRQLDVEKVLLVPAGVTIKGDIDTNGLASLLISGTVHGNVKAGAGSVIVREGGVVHGSIHSDDCVVIAGQVTGADGAAIVTSGLWILAETAVVRGDVAYARHRAYEGGVFSGRAIPFSEYKA